MGVLNKCNCNVFNPSYHAHLIVVATIHNNIKPSITCKNFKLIVFFSEFLI